MDVRRESGVEPTIKLDLLVVGSLHAHTAGGSHHEAAYKLVKVKLSCKLQDEAARTEDSIRSRTKENDPRVATGRLLAQV